MQYTIRAVPDEIDRALRQRARRESKSLNAVVIDALARGVALDVDSARHSDLDDLGGSWQEDPDFDRAVAEFERIDDDRPTTSGSRPSPSSTTWCSARPTATFGRFRSS